MVSKLSAPLELGRKEIWRHDGYCIVCQKCCSTFEDKLAHEKTQRHIKKLNIYDFFEKEACTVSSSDIASVFLQRYTESNQRPIGLETIHEFHFQWSSTPWWACSICFESGSTAEEVDLHLQSLAHLKTFVDEFYPDKAKEIKETAPNLLYDQLYGLRDELFDAQGGALLTPEILELSLSKTDAIAKLVISEPPVPYATVKVSDQKQIIVCHVCHELIPYTKKPTKAWDVHKETDAHRHAANITGLLDQFDLVEVRDTELAAEEVPKRWSERDGSYFGAVCGIKHLVVLGEQNFCALCCSTVASIEDHFSSELHISKFIATKYPAEMYIARQLPCSARRTEVLTLLTRSRLENASSRKTTMDRLPNTLLKMANEELYNVEAFMPPLTPLGVDSHCLFCPVCWLVVKVDDLTDGGAAVWNEHCEQYAHFDYAARRSAINKFDEENFILCTSSIPKWPKNMHGKWFDKQITTETTYRVQTQCDIGLEYVVEDEANDEVVCTLCARTYKRAQFEAINCHIRSYIHLNQYLHVMNRNLLSLLLVQQSEQSVQDLMLEWLQRSTPNILEDMRVYSPVKAAAYAKWGKVSMRKVDSTTYDQLHRDVYNCVMSVVDQVAGDGAENQEATIREALTVSGMKIEHIVETEGKPTDLLLRCTNCELVVATNTNKIVHDVWEDHLVSDEHFRRMTAYLGNKLDMYGFSETPSTYTVRPFEQKDPNKKVSWQWNAKEKVHDFVLSVVGLADIVERRSHEVTGEHPADFFCNICAVVIPRRAQLLEEHVRSGTHTISFVHKYRPKIFLELYECSQSDRGREMRRLVANALKDVPYKEYCIPVYDPVGEQERKGIVAMQKAKEVERQRQLKEQRERAHADRLKKEEERRKQREAELERERKRREEREQKEREARERAQKVEEERNRLRQIALEAAQRKEEEQRKLSQEKAKAHIASLLKDANRKKVLEEKNRLLKEKQELEMKLKAAQMERRAPIPEPQLVIPSRAQPMLGMPPPSSNYPLPSSNYPPPSTNYPPPSTNYPPPSSNYPPPAHLMGTSGPGFQPSGVPAPYGNYGAMPMNRELMEKIGPKPTFSTFVPVAEKMPVYPTEDERRRSRSSERSMSMSRSPSTPPPNVVVRASLRGRTIDRATNDICTRASLIDFIWRQGAEKIPKNEGPTAFNEEVLKRQGLLGVKNVYEVVCIDCPELDSLYCSICGVWGSPSQMIFHLDTHGHKLAYLFRNYKMYHQTLVVETNSVVKTAMLNQFAHTIGKMEPPGQVENRLRALLNKELIGRCWPDHVNHFENLPKPVEKQNDNIAVPAPVRQEDICSFDTNKGEKRKRDQEKEKDRPKEMEKAKKKDEKVPESVKRSKPPESPAEPEKKKRRSATPEKRRRSRSRSRERKRSRSRERRDRDRRRSRSKSRERKRSRSRSRGYNRGREHPSASGSSTVDRAKIDKNPGSWEEEAAAFLAKLGDFKAASRIMDHKKEKESGKTSSSSSSIRDEKKRPSSPRRSSGRTEADDITESIKLIRNLARPPPTSTLPVQASSAAIPQARGAPPPVTSRAPPQPECIVIDDDSPMIAKKAPQQKQTPAEPVDEKAEMRKLLGLLITMQQEAERNGGLNGATVDRLYSEMGLTKKDSLTNDQLLAQLCAQLQSASGEGSLSKPGIDLASFGISKKSQNPEVNMLVAQQQAKPVAAAAVSTPSTTVGYATSSSYTQPAYMTATRKPPSPLIKPPPFVITRPEEVFPDNDGFSYVYPEPDAEEGRQQKVDAPVNQAASATSTPQQGSSTPTDVPLTKKQQAALRKQKLLEEAERLRRQAEEADEDDDDDEWDSLGALMDDNVSAEKEEEKKDKKSKKQNNPPKNFGKPNTWAQPCRQPSGAPVPAKESAAVQPTIETTKQPEAVPIAPGQKMALARTILPNGQLPDSYLQQQRTTQTTASTTSTQPPTVYVAPAVGQQQSSAWAPSVVAQTNVTNSSGYGAAQMSQQPQQQYYDPNAYQQYYQQQQQWQQSQQPQQVYVAPQQQQQFSVQPGVPGTQQAQYNWQQQQQQQQMNQWYR